ncbi:MAG: hypothetical protein IJJ26_08600 [Victivallales bacterium]|nr:hypothetical protein [Victivallales bacterium]
MRFERLMGLVLVFALALAGFAQKGMFYLVDERTQIPVLCYPMEPNWLGGGKTTWTANPAAPVSWYVWTMSPDQRIKILFSSLAVIPAPGAISQVPILQNPLVMANQLLAGAQRDHNVTNLRLVDAHFNQKEPDRALIESRLRQAQQHGIRPTNMVYTELSIRYEGVRDGKPFMVGFWIPMLATENRPGMGFATVVELLSPMSFSCPPALEAQARKKLERISKNLQMNQQFTAVINRIAEQRTANWLRVQNQIRNEQLELAASTSGTHQRVMDKWSEYIRDVDTVSNPNTGEKMFVDNRYDHAWINSNNEVIYHNSGFNTPNASTSSFDPNSNALFNQTTWRKLK